MARNSLVMQRVQGSDGTSLRIDVEFLKASLSEYEKTVLLLLVRGYPTREIAREMALSIDYIYTLLHLLRAAFHTRTNAGIVACAFTSGLLDLNGQLRPAKSSDAEAEAIQ
jgi:DNA-binding CsgD family transcriptional regulator